MFDFHVNISCCQFYFFHYQLIYIFFLNKIYFYKNIFRRLQKKWDSICVRIGATCAQKTWDIRRASNSDWIRWLNKNGVILLFAWKSNV
ncbi:unnamed protein product [Caenorhabditis angaria]|uniref:Uncharacterized protein n=1 Tax=Caenorhabditis angaria TaxID=860376 RepID=A0A9P1IKU2_9PELO|nr:unnamed protein product [Caenorhabditis angaria]